MKRTAFAVATLLAVFSLPAAAADCAKDYKGFWDSFSTGPAKDLSGEQHAMVSRSALRAFDACTAGDEASSKTIFDKLREAAPAKGEDYWTQLRNAAPAKK